MAEGEESAEYRAFRSLYFVLQTEIQQGVADVASQAFSKSLISNEVKNQVTSRMSNQTESERTGILLDAVHNRIQVDTNTYEQFVAILDETPAYKDIADRMRSELEEKRRENRIQPNYQANGNAAKRKEMLLPLVIGSLCLMIGLYCWWYPASTSHALPVHNNTDHCFSNDLQLFEVPIQQNLPRTNSPFFGRQHDLENLKTILLSRSAQIINISGPPAFGKSTLAIQVGRELNEHHSDSIVTVRYIDTESTRQSWYLCKLSTNDKERTFHNFGTNALINGTESIYADSAETHEPNLCEWSQKLKQKSVLILDNCDNVLQGIERNEFINVIQRHLHLTEGHLSIIITSQERLEFLDESFTSWPIQELAPHDAVALLQHYAPSLNESYAANFSTIVGHCPLALKVIGKLLARRGAKNARTLLVDLKRQVVGTISDQITDNREQFRSIMDVAFNHLDTKTQNCSLVVSFFPGSFDSEIGRQIMSDMIDPACIHDAVQKSFIDESFAGDKTHYKMHKMIRGYFIEFYKTRYRSFYHDRSKFKSLFIVYYSRYLRRFLEKLYHQYDENIDMSVYAFLFLEAHNINYFVRLARQTKKQYKDDTVLALGLLIYENLIVDSNAKDMLCKKFYSHTDELFFIKFCLITSMKMCASTFWKTFASVSIPQCTSGNSYIHDVIFSFKDTKPCSEIFSCNSLAPFGYQNTLSLIREEVDTSMDSNKKLLLSLIENTETLCRHTWIRMMIQSFYTGIINWKVIISITALLSSCMSDIRYSLHLLLQLLTHFIITMVMNYVHEECTTFALCLSVSLICIHPYVSSAVTLTFLTIVFYLVTLPTNISRYSFIMYMLPVLANSVEYMYHHNLSERQGTHFFNFTVSFSIESFIAILFLMRYYKTEQEVHRIQPIPSSESPSIFDSELVSNISIAALVVVVVVVALVVIYICIVYLMPYLFSLFLSGLDLLPVNTYSNELSV